MKSSTKEKFHANARCRAAQEIPKNARIHLHLNEIIHQKVPLAWQKCGNIDIYKFGDSYDNAVAYSDKSKSFSTWSATITPEMIKTENRNLTGYLYSTVVQDDTINQYSYQLDIVMIDTLLAGKIYFTQNGSQGDTTLVTGNISPIDSIAEQGRIMMIDLHQSLENGKLMRIFINTNSNSIISAIAITPYNYTSTISLDFTGLKLDKEKLTGEISISAIPDLLYSKDTKPTTGLFTINATIKHSFISGSYTGFYNNANRKNKITGEVTRKINRDEIRGIYIHIDNALFGGSLNQNRVFMNLTMSGNKVTDAKIFPSPEYPCWTAEVIDQKIRLTDDFLNGHFIFDIHSEKVIPGRFHVILESQVIGNLFIGRYKCFAEKNQELKKQGNTNGALIRKE